MTCECGRKVFFPCVAAKRGKSFYKYVAFSLLHKRILFNHVQQACLTLLKRQTNIAADNTFLLLLLFTFILEDNKA